MPLKTYLTADSFRDVWWKWTFGWCDDRLKWFEDVGKGFGVSINSSADLFINSLPHIARERTLGQEKSWGKWRRCIVGTFFEGILNFWWTSGLPTSGLPSRGQSWGWAILSPSVIRIAHPKYYVILCNVWGPGWVLGTHAVSHIKILINKFF